MQIRQLMTTDVVTVPPETALKDVARLLDEHRFSGVPVCDDDKHVLGVVSETDIVRQEQGLAPERGRVFRWLVEPKGDSAGTVGARTAFEAMTSPAITVAPITDVARAARLMVEKNVNRLPVVEHGQIVGIVTRADLVRAFHRSDEVIEREIREDVLVRLLWIDPSPLEISVHDGEVAIAGNVANRSGAELVDAYVRSVPGVVSLVSNLTWTIDDLARRTVRSL